MLYRQEAVSWLEILWMSLTRAIQPIQPIAEMQATAARIPARTQAATAAGIPARTQAATAVRMQARMQAKMLVETAARILRTKSKTA